MYFIKYHHCKQIVQHGCVPSFRMNNEPYQPNIYYRCFFMYLPRGKGYCNTYSDIHMLYLGYYEDKIELLFINIKDVSNVFFKTHKNK